jgi:hypothetical protein
MLCCVPALQEMDSATRKQFEQFLHSSKVRWEFGAKAARWLDAKLDELNAQHGVHICLQVSFKRSAALSSWNQAAPTASRAQLEQLTQRMRDANKGQSGCMNGVVAPCSACTAYACGCLYRCTACHPTARRSA